MTVNDKIRIREQMRARRRAVPPEQATVRAQRLRRSLFEAPFMQNVERVMCYCAHDGEIDTLELIRQMLARGFAVSVPMVTGPGLMQAQRIDSCDDLTPGRFGILAPARPGPAEAHPQVSLCPGCAFTERGDRVGSGRGYYDRYLAAHPDLVPVGLAYDFQIVPALPVEETDRRMRWIVTDARVLDCGA